MCSVAPRIVSGNMFILIVCQDKLFSILLKYKIMIFLEFLALVYIVTDFSNILIKKKSSLKNMHGGTGS